MSRLVVALQRLPESERGDFLASVTVIEKQTRTETTGSKREDTNKVLGQKQNLKTAGET